MENDFRSEVGTGHEGVGACSRPSKTLRHVRRPSIWIARGRLGLTRGEDPTDSPSSCLPLSVCPTGRRSRPQERYSTKTSGLVIPRQTKKDGR